MAKDYRFKKRNGVYYVLYRWDPDHPKSTGQTELADAIAWAERHRDGVHSDPSVLLGDFARDFFAPHGRYYRMLRDRGIEHGEAHRSRCEGILDRYILPRLGHFPVATLRRRHLDDWLLALELAAATKTKILSVLRVILDEAVAQELAVANVASQVKPFHGRSRAREIFFLEELKLLFPTDREELLRIWLEPDWALYFLILATTGLRPGEMMALTWADWFPQERGILVSKAVENCTKKVKSTKTGTVRVALLTPAVAAELDALRELYPGSPEDRIFPRATHWLETGNKHFRSSCRRAGVDPGTRTQYCLRHTFNTRAVAALPLGDVQKLMGHLSPEHTLRTYNHPGPEELFAALRSARSGLEASVSNWYQGAS